MNKFILTLSMMLVFSSAAIAREGGGGSEGGGGGGVLARLLVYAQGYLLAEIPQAGEGLGLPETFLTDLAGVRFVPVDEDQELTDPHFGYKTWIRILPGKPVTIEYNPSPEYYGSIVEGLEEIPDSEALTKAPRLKDVIGFLLHELGHHYGHSEEDSWKFAFRVQKALDASPSIKEKTCTLALQEPRKAWVKRSFSLKATDEVVISIAMGNFLFSHIFEQSAKPQLMLQLFHAETRLALRSEANAPVDLMHETPSIRFRLQCSEKK